MTQSNAPFKGAPELQLWCVSGAGPSMRKVSKRAANQPPSFSFQRFFFRPSLHFFVVAVVLCRGGAVSSDFCATSLPHTHFQTHRAVTAILSQSPEHGSQRGAQVASAAFLLSFLSHIAYPAAAASCFCFSDCSQHCLLAHTKARSAAPQCRTHPVRSAVSDRANLSRPWEGVLSLTPTPIPHPTHIQRESTVEASSTQKRGRRRLILACARGPLVANRR